MIVFLVGPMGAGKSTIGKKLSQKLNAPFIDMDIVIVEQAKTDIPTIFAQYGEAYFRDLEHQCLAQILEEYKDQTVVIAGGGGIAQRKDNAQLIKDNTCCLYLNLPVEIQYQRVKGDPNRPMLKGGDERERLNALYQNRHPQFVAIAKATIDASLSKSKVVANCLEQIQK